MKQTLDTLFRQIKIDTNVLKQNSAVFEEAFTHRSLGKAFHNERLEFLGDAVLELVTTEFLFHSFPNCPEGDMTNYRSALVKRENLALVARKLKLGDLLFLSKGEEASGGREKDYLLANVVEALIGALYITVGFKESARFVTEGILIELEAIIKNNSHIDAKSALQELTQGEHGVTPHYQTMSESGLDHEKTFEVAVFLGEVKLAVGSGNSKKEGQVEAAAKALEKKEDWTKKLK